MLNLALEFSIDDDRYEAAIQMEIEIEIEIAIEIYCWIYHVLQILTGNISIEMIT